jgi:cytochrome c oxidase cbb3-type subunit III
MERALEKNHMKHASVTLGNLMVLTTLLGSLSVISRAQDNPRIRSSESDTVRRVQAKAAFEKVCASCHGLDGRGGERGPDIVSRQDVVRKTDPELIKIVTEGKTAAGMPSFASLGADRISAIVAELRTLQGGKKEASLPGDPARGKDLFYGAARCSQCHMVNGQGGFLGPDLTGYGATNSGDGIRAAIVGTNKDLDPRRGLVTVRLSDSTVLLGLTRNEDNFSLQLQTLDGVFHLLNKSDIRSIQYEGRSAMPADYGSTVSREELNDLVSFLLRASGSGNGGRAKNNSEDDEE